MVLVTQGKRRQLHAEQLRTDWLACPLYRFSISVASSVDLLPKLQAISRSAAPTAVTWPVQRAFEPLQRRSVGFTVPIL